MTKNILKVLVSNFCIAIVGIVTSFVFPRLMSIDAYSQYQAFNLYLSYIGFCQLGLSTGMVINYAGKQRESVDKKQFKSEICLQLLILSLFTILFGVAYLSTGQVVIRYICICLIPYCFAEAYKSLYQAWAEFSKYSLINTFIPIMRVVIVLVVFVTLSVITDKTVIHATIVCYYLVFGFVAYECAINMKGVKASNIFSKENMLTLWLGLRILLGNYLDTLFKTVDKLFVNVFFDSYNFAMYSFAMTMHNIMNIFITSIAQPMFPYMASHDLEERKVKYYEELLLIFGALAGCAYFACSFIIKNFIPKYIDSINVMFAYFLSFPALSVINCIFINLYKIRRETKTYIVSLIILIVISTIFNGSVIFIFKGIVSIAVATTIVYYLWFIYGTIHFKKAKMKLRDIVFIFLYFIIFYISARLLNDIIGFFTYVILIAAVSICCYKKTIREFVIELIRRCKKNES